MKPLIMKRREFLGVLATSSVATAIAQDVAAPNKQPLIVTPLVLMAPRSDGIEAVWAVSRLSKGHLEWKSNEVGGVATTDAFGMVPQSETVLRVRLSGLKPGTSYEVRSHTIAAEDEETIVSAWKTFRTLDPAASTTRFVMWNDTHIHDDTIRQLDEQTPGADFLLWNGDTCNNWTNAESLVPVLLHPAERDITAKRPLFITWGNHDVRGPYAYKVPGIVATPQGRPFYAFRSGPLAAICLHTGEDKPDDHPSFRGRVSFDALRAEQALWLKETIRRPEFRDAPYRLVFCHIPLRWTDERPPDYAAGGFDFYSGRSRAAWHDTLVEWRAQVVLSGHTHEAAWLPPSNEFPYGQLVGGGPKPAQATWTEGIADATQLVLMVRSLTGKILHEVALAPRA